MITEIIFGVLGFIWKLLTEPTHPKKLKVTRVIDGDSIRAESPDGKSHEIRVRGIDAPELSQEHGYEAKLALEALVKNKTITLKDQETDKFGRIAATVITPDGKNSGEVMARTGNAWACDFRATSSQQSAQKKAQKEKIGLWAKPKPQVPWKYRQNGPEM